MRYLHGKCRTYCKNFVRFKGSNGFRAIKEELLSNLSQLLQECGNICSMGLLARRKGLVRWRFPKSLPHNFESNQFHGEFRRLPFAIGCPKTFETSTPSNSVSHQRPMEPHVCSGLPPMPQVQKANLRIHFCAFPIF